MTEKKYGEHSCLTIPKAAEIVNLDIRTFKNELEKGAIVTKWIKTRQYVVYGSLMKWLYGDVSADDAAKQFLMTNQKRAG